MSFNGRDGLSPEASLVQGTDGNFYGTTFGGGASGYGTAFRLTPNGRVTVLHSFSYSDGAYPLSGLLLGTDGSFYGTTFGGGSDVCFVGCGTVFKIARNGAFTTLYAFGLSDGAKPHSGLAEGVDGYFYGTTAYGGANESCMVGSFVGCGTVFKITPAGKLTSLYNFAGGDGANPEAGLIQASDGNFYGTTDAGGANSFCNAGGAVGCGTVFKITPNGVLTTLHSFNGNDGANPLSALIQARDGRLYGTTFDGGLVGSGCGNNSCGTIFRITLSGTLTTLHFFKGATDGIDGGNSGAPLVQATDGNFYGTTTSGGQAEFYGTIFEMTPSGTLTLLWSFSPNNDGANPYGGLLQYTSGNLYGTTVAYGDYRDGTGFTESLELGSLATTVPAAAKVGRSVMILGTNLTGAISVTFNGTAATFKVVSGTEISTRVPTGATTGTVQVVTPGGTLNSNVPFRVLP